MDLTPNSAAGWERQLGILSVNQPRTFPAWVLLDRDGTINVERHYLSTPKEVELLPGAAAGLRRLQQLGSRLVIVTNQSGVARGYFDAAQLDRIHDRLRDLLAQAGVEIAAVLSCLHSPDDNCDCRKPRPGLALAAARQFGFSLADIAVIGDKRVDVELGQAVGATTVLVRTGYGAAQEGLSGRPPDIVADDLTDAARQLEQRFAVGAEA